MDPIMGMIVVSAVNGMVVVLTTLIQHYYRAHYPSSTFASNGITDHK